MLVVEKMKLNKFRAVACIDPQDLYKRVGSRAIPEIQDGQVADFNQNTMDALCAAEAAWLAGVDVEQK